MNSIYLTTEKMGTPVAKIYNKNNSEIIIYLVVPDDSYYHKKKCCKKCKGDFCLGGCCRYCCNLESISSKSKKSKCCEESDSDDDISNDLDLLDEDYFRQMKLPYRTSLERFKSDIKKKQIKPEKYKLTKKYINAKKEKEIIIYSGEIQPLPRKNSRECIYVAGPSGSGKSTYISNYAQEYKNMFPNNKIYIFSRLESDAVLDKLKPVRIMINDELIEDPIEPNELSNSLVIFDDTDTIPNKQLKDAITNLKNDLLETGRHEDVYVAITSHLLTNHRETRTILNECHTITIFPAAGSTYSINYLLKNYGGLDKPDIHKIINLPSRWVTIKKTYPQLIMYSSGIYLLNKQN